MIFLGFPRRILIYREITQLKLTQLISGRISNWTKLMPCSSGVYAFNYSDSGYKAIVSHSSQLCLCQFPRSSQSHKTCLRILSPSQTLKPITPLFLSGWLRFCKGVFLSYFSKSSKVSFVCSVEFFDSVLLKPKVDKRYKHKNQ